MLFFFLRLYLAHMIADFPLQNDFIFRLKTTHKHIGALPHIIIHIIVMVIVMLPFIYSWRMIGCILFISLIHYISDTKKVDTNIVLKQSNTPYSQLMYFAIDQIIHLITIFLAVSIFFFPHYSLTPLAVFPEPVMSIYLAYNEFIIVLIFVIFGLYGTQAMAFIVSGLFFKPENVAFKEHWKAEFIQKLYRMLLMMLFLLPGRALFFAIIPIVLNIAYIRLGKYQRSYSLFKEIVATSLAIILAAMMRFLVY